MFEIKSNGKVLARIDSVDNFTEGLAFYGSPLDYVQVGTFKYNKGQKLRDHKHKFRVKVAHKTQEILIVFRGSVIARTFDEDNTLASENVLEAGDFYISYWGGCGFTVLDDDTRLMEVKNGPHDVNDDDEERVLL